MDFDVYALAILFAVALSAFVTAINARGVVRIVLSYVLATLILVLAVFTYIKAGSQKELARKEAEKAKIEEQLRKAEEDARAAAEAAAAAASAPAPVMQGAVEYKPLIDQGLAVAKGILAIDVDGEFDYDKVTAAAAGFKARAADIKKKIDAMPKPSNPETAALRDQMDKAVKSLVLAANYFALFFKAENETEEDQRWEVYQNNAKSARAILVQAASRLEGQ